MTHDESKAIQKLQAIREQFQEAARDFTGLHAMRIEEAGEPLSIILPQGRADFILAKERLRLLAASVLPMLSAVGVRVDVGAADPAEAWLKVVFDSVPRPDPTHGNWTEAPPGQGPGEQSFDRLADVFTASALCIDGILARVPAHAPGTVEGDAQAATPESPPDTARLSAHDLAQRFGVGESALYHRLERWRKNNGNGWYDVPSPARNEPKIVYQVQAVMPVIHALQDKAKRQTNGSPQKK